MTIFHSRENDPQVAAKRLLQPGEAILPSRGNYVGSDACGPHVRIMSGGQVRGIVVSERGGHGYDD